MFSRSFPTMAFRSTLKISSLAAAAQASSDPSLEQERAQVSNSFTVIAD